MRGVARKEREQQAVRGRIGEHDAVGCIAVLANEIEERGEVRRKQQWGFTSNSAWHREGVSAYPLNVRYWGLSGHRADLSRLTQAGIAIASVFFGHTKTRAAFWQSSVTASYSRFSIY